MNQKLFDQAKLTEFGKQAPLAPLVLPVAKVAPQPKAVVARVGASMPQAEADRITALAREMTLANGGTAVAASELIRAGLALLASLSVPDRLAAIAKLSKSSKGTQ